MREFLWLAVLMITTETHFASVARAIAACANNYVMKSFTEEMLVDKLRN